MTSPSSTDVLLAVDDLRAEITTAGGVIHPVDGVSLSVHRGEILGIVGESGSGKSLLLRSIMGLIPDGVTVTGRVVFDGDDLVAMKPERRRQRWGPEIAMILQNPMACLNPVVRVGRLMTEGLHVHRRLEGKRRDVAVDLLRSVGIADATRRASEYPHQLSGGMRQRAAIAAALSCRPRLLLADEPTTALDVTVQAQILELLHEQRRARGMAMILVSHDLGVVAEHADRVAVMYAGQIVEQGRPAELFSRPRMPYTRLLLNSIPRLDEPSHARLPVIDGAPPDLHDVPTGCRFAARCPHPEPHCLTNAPPLVEYGTPAHLYRCWNPERTVAPRVRGR